MKTNALSALAIAAVLLSAVGCECNSMDTSKEPNPWNYQAHNVPANSPSYGVGGMGGTEPSVAPAARLADAGGPVPASPEVAHHENMWESVTEAVAVIEPTKGSSISGVIHFAKEGEGVHVHGTVSGLAPNSVHAIHIHEFGDVSSDDGMAAGGHFNPEHHQHGAPTAPEHHAGDLGNLTADASGVATIDLVLPDVSVAGMHNPIIGRGVVIHAKEDDMKTQPTGNAGGRIGVGVIGIGKPPAPAK